MASLLGLTADMSRRGGASLVVSDYTAEEHTKCWATFLMVTLASYVISPYFKKLGFPGLTGNVIVGAICGPYVLGIVQKDDVNSLGYINMFALAYITTSAGAELIVEELRKTLAVILSTVAAMFIFIFAVVALVTKGLANTSLSSFTNDMSDSQQWAVAMIMAGIATTGSPAAAVAVVRELGAKGKLTAVFLGILMTIDVVVLIAMPMVLANADAEFTGIPFKAKTAGVVIGTLIASALLGLIVALAYMSTMRVPRAVLHNLVFPIGFCVFLACAYLTDFLSYHITEEGVHVSFEPLLMCMVGGFVTVNFSKYHHRFVEALEHAGPMIFLPFFTLVGCSLDLITFVKALPFAIVLSIVRMICIFAGTAGPGFLLGQARQQNLTLWMTQVSQAGFSLGLAAQMGKQFKPWGTEFQAVIISCVVVNAFIGPLLCKMALNWSGEAGKALSPEEEAYREAENDPLAIHIADQKKAIIIGVSPKSKAVALALLKKRWGVTVLTRTVEEASIIGDQVIEWADRFRKEYLAANQEEVIDVSALVLHHEHNFTAVPLIMPDLEECTMERDPNRRPSVMSVTMAELSHEVAGERFGGVFEADAVQALTAQSERASIELPPAPHNLTQHVEPRPVLSVKNMARQSGESFRTTGDGTEKDDSVMARNTSLDTMPRNNSFDMLLPRGVMLGNMQPVGIENVLDITDALQTVVLSLESDKENLALLKMLMSRWGAKASKIRVVVLIKEAESADAVSLLGAVAVHDFVAAHSQAVLASITPYEKDAVLVHGSATQSTWSAAWLDLYDQNAWSKC
mmetsp:Transcript_1766/g.4035  ORF Transcript_1766/g.4035 Transcript_1766/m.4035 type:complete len:800 (+) Transcript_1766:86-2485(+)|eukprot:CAMPEP_0177698354 /NCGR_PEP_ID=MMETSP0484_2-20121128/4997_1 /TAXON_ID=354590 /ORGANISM="Rhodomonas lens, Strain RHODO" /LENGTH=799 /DNA_ID=CAMNT_0019209443 /DNA_START=86 /DNA_END=2485 /DNA_ORIENTATION=-